MRARAGPTVGRLYGYVRQYALSAAGKRELVGQVRDPDTALVVERIFTSVSKARSLRAIAARLNRDAITAPGGGTWSAQSVRDLCLNPAYAGLRLHVAGRRSGHDRTRDGVLVPGKWEAIVSPETFHGVRAILTDPGRRTSRPGRGKHLLSMVATCAPCGGLMTVRYRRGVGEYWCRNSGHVRIRQDELDEYVTGMVLGRLAMPDLYAAVASRDTSAAVQAARDELAAARAHHKAMLELMKARRMSPMAFADAEPAALADIEKAEDQLRQLETAPALRRLLGDPGEDIKERWEDAPMAARREAVRILFERLAVERTPAPGHRVHVTDRLTYQWRQQP